MVQPAEAQAAPVVEAKPVAAVKMIDEVVPQTTRKVPDVSQLCEHVGPLVANHSLVLGVDANKVTGFLLRRMGPPTPNLAWAVCPWCQIPCTVEQP